MEGKVIFKSGTVSHTCLEFTAADVGGIQDVTDEMMTHISSCAVEECTVTAQALAQSVYGV